MPGSVRTLHCQSLQETSSSTIAGKGEIFYWGRTYFNSRIGAWREGTGCWIRSDTASISRVNNVFEINGLFLNW
jgi:hypothetical protein